MPAFRHRRHAPQAPRRPVDGHGAADLVVMIRRCIYGEVWVVGTERYPEGRIAIAGTRPRRADDLCREKTVRVRLVREPDDRGGPDTIGVVTEDGVRVGDVCHTSARRMAPAIDQILEEIATSRECAGCTVDVRCTAFVVAEWDGDSGVGTRAGGDAPTLLEVTLLVDDLDLGSRLAAPELPVLV
jgi:hypothetical protein